ncbi:hypothetical protein HDU91_000378 [Kappamyces sp. JEL0680]|nr:hypothetical protein HDU91_000378 [Kappamyces sp. JEL0680]
MDVSPQRLISVGLDPEPLEIIVLGLHAHVNHLVGRLLQEQRSLDQEAILLDSQISRFSNLFATRLAALKSAQDQSKQLDDVLPQAKQTREVGWTGLTMQAMEGLVRDMNALQPFLPVHLSLDSDRIQKRYPAMTSFFQDVFLNT